MMRKVVQRPSFFLTAALIALSSPGFCEEIKQVIFSESEFGEERRIVQKLLKTKIKDAERIPGSDKVVIKIALIDLNQDGRNEILAYIQQRRYFCGQLGCPFMVLFATPGGGWKNALEDLSVVQEEDIATSDHRTNGYQDIVLGGDSIWIWNGKQYAFAKSTRSSDSKKMDHAPFNELSQEASHDLMFLPFPSQLKKYEVHPAGLLKFPEFETVYHAILGPEVQTNWIRSLRGPATPARLLRTPQAQYVVAQTCMPHACNTDSMIIIFDYQSNKCWAKITENEVVTWLGKPTDDVKSMIEKIQKGKVKFPAEELRLVAPFKAESEIPGTGVRIGAMTFSFGRLPHVRPSVEASHIAFEVNDRIYYLDETEGTPSSFIPHGFQLYAGPGYSYGIFDNLLVIGAYAGATGWNTWLLLFEVNKEKVRFIDALENNYIGDLSYELFPVLDETPKFQALKDWDNDGKPELLIYFPLHKFHLFVELSSSGIQIDLNPDLYKPLYEALNKQPKLTKTEFRDRLVYGFLSGALTREKIMAELKKPRNKKHSDVADIISNLGGLNDVLHSKSVLTLKEYTNVSR